VNFRSIISGGSLGKISVRSVRVIRIGSLLPGLNLQPPKASSKYLAFAFWLNHFVLTSLLLSPKATNGTVSQKHVANESIAKSEWTKNKSSSKSELNRRGVEARVCSFFWGGGRI